MEGEFPDDKSQMPHEHSLDTVDVAEDAKRVSDSRTGPTL